MGALYFFSTLSNIRQKPLLGPRMIVKNIECVCTDVEPSSSGHTAGKDVESNIRQTPKSGA